MARLQRLGVLFSAKLQAIQWGCVGVIAGVFYAVGGFLYELVTGTLNSGTLLAFGALIGMPLVFGAFGFLAGVIGAVLYNLVARRFGGIELDIDQRA